ncbi:MAG TPA: hypothetical protein VN856_13260 [Mycobacterium sp.]|uniref:hypothetical protein n=1 Tax=Mycobacterium sp. TaxID=1785 RepID=UPI002BD51CC7|nr:hypothetical protein [Mycobacterium sp.]HXO80845.1 hypothetical protein [Mycobacterium sp.]
MSADAELLPGLNRVLDRRVSVGALIEVAVWLAAGYLAVGLTWSLFHPEGVQRLEEQLEQRLQLPAGTNYQLAALGEASMLWPVASVLPALNCAH